MTARCAAVGVKIYADCVVNHMAAAPSSTSYGVAGTSYEPGRKYAPYNYDAEMTHHTDGNAASNCAVTDYTNAWNVQNCDLVGLVDLDTQESSVRAVIGGYLQDLMAHGASGVRIDAAKHMATDDVGEILAYLPDDTFAFQEVIYGEGEAVTPEEYTGNGHVTEFRFGTNIYDNFNSNADSKMQYMTTFGESWGLISSDSAVVFTDNHDTQRSASNVLTYKDGENYNLANYFMLAHPYGYPKVMSSYYFTDSDSGPPSTPVHSNEQVNCDDGSNWVCEHRRTGIANMVGFRNAANGTSATNWQTDSTNGNFVAFSREDRAFIAINMDKYSSWSAVLTVGVPDGSYCNIIATDSPCDDDSTVIVSSGIAKMVVPALGAVAFHV